MTQVAYNSALLKRVARVAVVALCTASSLVLLGAMPANQATPAAKTVKAAPAPVAKQAVAARPVQDEMLADVADAALPATAVMPAAPRTRVIQMEVTAYCACTKCCGPAAQGITASGKLVSYNGGRFVAADTALLPFGTRVVIPGYAGDEAVEVIDRGGAIKGNKLDLYFDSHDEALEWGRQMLEVTVIE
jgi:3D (Asp-Asp-Asp) domain-containing protein